MNTLETSKGKSSFARRSTKIVAIVVGLLILIGAGIVVGLVIANNVFGGVKVPADIAQQAKSPIYLSATLPGTYQVVRGSFLFDENTLVYSAKNASGESIVFTQQPKPADFNFDDFYQQQLTEARTVESGEYASVSGKTKDGKYMLSIVTKDTWIVVSMPVLLSDSDLQIIAKGMKRA
jgi:hypothetical protein